MRVGCAGLGAMGGGMCRRLADRGFDVVAYDVDAEVAAAAGAHPGVRAAAGVADLAAPVVVTMLPDGAAVRQVAGELLPHLPAGALIIDTGSSAPEDTLALGRAAAAHGVSVVDAPVSGSPAAARAGELTLMAAGEPGDVERGGGVGWGGGRF
ncbi:NAD(P)-binding domain-containing protein, partial [Streptomyces sp. NPDC004135]